jgi:5S rRNA maturation endonuclease (ribonuclease M5)
MLLAEGKLKAVLYKLNINPEFERGDELTAICPGHEIRTGKYDNNPSWSINTESGVHHCFSCGYKGNLLTLVAEQLALVTENDRLDIDAAKRWLTINSGIDLEMLVKQMESIKEAHLVLPKPVPISEARLAIYSKVPAWALGSRDLTTEACEYYGVLWEESTSNWILPIRTWEDDTLLGWQEKGQVNRHFRNRPAGVLKSQTIFNDGLGLARCIVVESPLDAVRLRSMGVNGGVSTFGAAISNEQLSIIRNNYEKIVFAFDNDPMGRKASNRMLELSRSMGFECEFFNYSQTDAKDVGDMSEDEIHFGLDNARHCVLGKAALLG